MSRTVICTSLNAGRPITTVLLSLYINFSGHSVVRVAIPSPSLSCQDSDLEVQYYVGQVPTQFVKVVTRAPLVESIRQTLIAYIHLLPVAPIDIYTFVSFLPSPACYLPPPFLPTTVSHLLSSFLFVVFEPHPLASLSHYEGIHYSRHCNSRPPSRLRSAGPDHRYTAAGGLQRLVRQRLRQIVRVHPGCCF